MLQRQGRNPVRWNVSVMMVAAQGSDGTAMQVVYLDVDTLWIDSMANVEQEFIKMREKIALFGMSIETTALNGNGSWYKGGRPVKNSASLASELLRLCTMQLSCRADMTLPKCLHSPARRSCQLQSNCQSLHHSCGASDESDVCHCILPDHRVDR